MKLLLTGVIAKLLFTPPSPSGNRSAEICLSKKLFVKLKILLRYYRSLYLLFAYSYFTYHLIISGKIYPYFKTLFSNSNFSTICIMLVCNIIVIFFVLMYSKAVEHSLVFLIVFLMKFEFYVKN